ncbi:MAG: 23S rRNA (pseudouridine(1915)-N(3))-methyltransferase RlmH [Clostridiales bacterium]|nr:23S rRNA (pseudouridine(1915)-N(3))-methyltransferase RlmH [Clostridiales bacterium]
MKIRILCVGKVKEAFFSNGIEEYQKRLSRYCKLEVIEVGDEKTPDGASQAFERQIKEKEGERLLKYMKESGSDSYTIALAIQGKQMDSVAFSEKIQMLGVRGVGQITFVIGGSLGLSDAVMNQADEALSFSKMTFPHQMMRMILLEQIYRGFRIMKGEPYHK